MSFLYPRTVSIARPTGTANANGVQPSQEFRANQLTAIASGLPCSIQVERNEPAPLVGAPGGTVSRGGWRIFIPKSAASVAGIATPVSILNRDVATDDGGLRYQVTHAYWHPLGWQLRCERLQS